MQLFFMLSSLLFVQAAVVKQKECDGIVYNNIYHEKEILKSEIDRPYLLAVEYSKNTIFFSYSLNLEDDVFKSARLNINTKEFKEIEGVSNGFAQTVNPKTHEVYIGGDDGIYKCDRDSNKAEFFAHKDANIWTIYFKDVLYYSEFPSQFLYTLVDGESTRFKDLEDTKVDHFVIDNEDYLFFSNETGLYSQKKGTKDAVSYKPFPSVGLRALTTDINGNAYACFQDGIYAIKKASVSLEKVVEIDDAFGLAFDNDNNIVYADSVSLVRLKPNKDKSC